VLYGTLAIYLLFNWMYRCANWYQVILPAYPLILLGVAAAANRWQAHFAQPRPAPAARRWLAYLPLLLLAGAIVWRTAASWERADSSDRPGDTALARAGVLLGSPLPPSANLFAATEDALALDYLIHIWGLRPDAQVVSSTAAGERLAAGETVYSTYAVAPVLLSELPPDLPVGISGAGADWLALRTAPLPPAPPAHTLDQAIAPGVALRGYTVTPAADGAPVTVAPPAADVTLYWELPAGWPEGLGISLRPTQGGAFLPAPGAEQGAIVQVDAPAPLHGLAPAGSALVADSYRVPLPAGADGILLIVYDRVGSTFRNLLELPLPLATGGA
jgi:hypothetical protein